MDTEIKVSAVYEKNFASPAASNGACVVSTTPVPSASFVSIHSPLWPDCISCGYSAGSRGGGGGGRGGGGQVEARDVLY